MPVVWVVQDVPKLNITGASKFGSMRVLLEPGKQIMFSPWPIIKKLRVELADYQLDDYVLPIGDPAAIGVVCALVSDMTDGYFKMLKWDRINHLYYEVQIDLWPEERDRDGVPSQ